MKKLLTFNLDSSVFSIRDMDLIDSLVMLQVKGLFCLTVSSLVIAELSAIPQADVRNNLLSLAQNMTVKVFSSVSEQLTEDIRLIMFPRIDKNHKKYTKQLKDVRILSAHITGKAGYLVTRDRHFLQHRDKLLACYQIRIITPEECQAIVIKL